MDVQVKVLEARKNFRKPPRWVRPKYGRGYYSTTQRSYEAKPRLYMSIKGESVLEDFAYRMARPTKLYREALDEIFERLGLPRATKATWSQKAGCSCGCSPGFILTIPNHAGFSLYGGQHETPYDVYATIDAADPAALKVKRTDKALAEANSRATQLAAQVS